MSKWRKILDKYVKKDNGYADGKKYCTHYDATEPYPGLFLGSASSDTDMSDVKNVDIIVSLASLDGNIWKGGWRGEIVYVPICDRKALPAEVLLAKAKYVAKQLKDGKRVGILCVGGHGRTGYFAATVLGLVDPKLDPIEYLREKYCKKIIESKEQIDGIAEALNRPELKTHKPAKSDYDFGAWKKDGQFGHWYGGGDLGYEADIGTMTPIDTLLDECRNCANYDLGGGLCKVDGNLTGYYAKCFHNPTKFSEDKTVRRFGQYGD